MTCSMPPASARAALEPRRFRVQRKREDQEQIADLRDRRVSDQELQAPLTQRHDASEHDGCCAEHSEDQRPVASRQRRHDIEPQPDHKEERPLDDQRRQRRARGGGGSRVRGWQPQMQREKGGLGEQPGRHQCQGADSHEVGPDELRQPCNVERSVTAVEQGDAQQIEDRADNREQQIAQRRLERFGTAIEAHQRNGGERQQLHCDIQREEVAADADEVHRTAHAEQQRPEDERRSRFDDAGGRQEVRAGVHRNRTGDCGRRHHHRRREPIGAQRDAEWRGPAADDIGQRLSALPEADDHHERDDEIERQDQHRQALDVAPAKQQRQQNARHRQHDGGHQQLASCCRRG